MPSPAQPTGPAAAPSPGANMAQLQQQQQQQKQGSDPKTTLSHDLEAISESFRRGATFSDLTLTTASGEQFSCHKVILSARSEVFKSLLLSNGATKKDVLIKVTDMRPGTLRALLNYVYTDRLVLEDGSPVFGSLCDIWSAANRYHVLGLAEVCEDRVAKELDVQNAVQAAIAAHLHGSENMKAKTFLFVMEHLPEVSKTSDWQTVRKGHDGVPQEIYDKVWKALMANYCKPTTKSGRP